jgi:hypothetical protein
MRESAKFLAFVNSVNLKHRYTLSAANGCLALILKQPSTGLVFKGHLSVEFTMHRLVTALALFIPTLAQAANELNLIAGAQAWPPYYTVTPDKPWTGIGPGIVQASAKSFNYEVKFISLKETTTRELIWSEYILPKLKDNPEEIFCTLDSPTWMGDLAKDKAISDPVVTLNELFVFRKGQFPAKQISYTSIPVGEKVAVGKDWNYPELEADFKSGRIRRVDIPAEKDKTRESLMLKALLSGTVNLAFLQPDIVGYMIKEKTFEKGKLGVLSIPGKGGKLTLVCHKNRAAEQFLIKFNAKLKQMNETIISIREKFVEPM